MRKLLNILLLQTVVFFVGNAQDYYFKHLDINNGLSQTSVVAIHQDHLQRIWLGTREGLNLYDGVKMKTFLPSKQDSSSLLNYGIISIKQQGHTLWVLTQSGLNSIDLDLMKFSAFPLWDQDPTKMEVYQDEIYLGTKQGKLFSFDTKAKRYEELLLNDFEQEITCLYQISNRLMIGGGRGKLLEYNLVTKKQNDYLNGEIKTSINAVFQDENQSFWLGTSYEGVYLFDSTRKIIEHFTSKNVGNTRLVNDIVRDIVSDNQGNIWVGTFNGVSVIHKDRLSVKHLEPSKTDPRALSWHSVYDLMLDQSGNMWIGTYFGGVNYTNTNEQVYTFYESDVEGRSPSGRVIGTMLEDENKNLWIATEGNGLNFHNTKTRFFKHFGEQSSQGNHNHIRSLLFTDKNTLYIGTHLEGLNVLNIKTGEIKQYFGSAQEGEGVPKIVNCLIKYKDKLLLGCKKGLIVFDPKSKKFSKGLIEGDKSIEVNESIYSLYEDSYGKIWIGTEVGGLITFDPTSGIKKRYIASTTNRRSIGANSIYKIMEDHRFRIWIATLGGGLSYYQPKTDDFLTFTKENNGLVSDFVYGLEESRYGDLWVSTSKGLSRFDVENNTFYSYTRENGFPYGELNQGGLLLSSTGILYVGSIHGMISIDEKVLFKQSPLINLMFSTLTVNNEEVLAFDHNDILKRDISLADMITLDASHTSIALDYATCNYSDNFNKYQVQLSGFNNKWIDVGNTTRVSYTNLSSGEYILKVRAIDAVYNSPVAEKSIMINVLPPFYLTWYAYLFYVIVFMALIGLSSYTYASRIRLKMEVQDKKNIRKLNKDKLQFFTNISHEFMTPLTLILGSLETVIQGENMPVRISRKLRLTYKNALRLKHLSGELLDFRKLEQGFLKLKVREHRFNNYLSDIVAAFKDQAQRRGIQFEEIIPKTEITLWYDNFQLDKVFYNLISNAFKAVSDKSGEITIELRDFESHVEVYVKDNGPGIPEESIARIFDRFYQSNNLTTKQKGSGLGLALSEGIVKAHKGDMSVVKSSSKGTVFKVELLKCNEHFDKGQLKEVDVIQKEKDYLSDQVTHLFSGSFTLDNKDITEIIPESAPKILIVEDNKEVQSLLHEVLSVDYNIILAEDGKEGLQKALESNPDLVISDVMMPLMSGIQLCTKLKRSIQTSHIPVILLTARTAMDHKLEGLNIGADDYITKPFDIIYLKTKIVNLFENRKRLQDKFSKSLTVGVKDVTKNAVDKAFMEEAEAFLEKHISNESLNVLVFAQEMGQSRTLFFKKIKSITGQTPNDFIQTYRLKKAASIIRENTGKNISEIAYEIGFTSPKYFSKCFKEHFGVIPSQYFKYVTE